MSEIAMSSSTARSVAAGANRELLGAKRTPVRASVRTNDGPRHIHGVRTADGYRAAEERPISATSVLETEEAPAKAAPKPQPSEIEKIVRRMPTLYVIAFFSTIVLCAVAIIWNTLQVNRLTLQRNTLDTQIAQTEQRLTRLRAEEMQLSAPSRIRTLAQTQLGMSDATAEDIITVH